jgi:glutamate/tyrosine decarboxylase-like PLP-dependent enzyme
MDLNPETDSEQFRDMAVRAVDIVERYYAELPTLPAMPVTTAATVRDLLNEPLPQEGATMDDALNVIRDVVYPLSRHNGHPRFFGYVASPGTPAASVGDLLTAGLNANVTAWRSSPAAAELEHVVIDWFKSIVGVEASATGLLVSGGSMANLSGLAAARTAADQEIGRFGCGNKPALRIYVSTEGHFSMQKAARLLGIGSENVQSIPADAHMLMDIVELEHRINSDRQAGFRPMCIVGNAGTTSTGAFDSLSDLADVASRHHLWFHVDGAYGGFAALAPSTKHLFAGIERADSIALDPHKWLYTSMGCGCVLYRDPKTATAAFSYGAEYTRPVGLSHDEAFVFWDFGPELSRPFRALTVWLQIKLYGARNLGESIENNMACARYFGQLVENAEDFELLVPVALSIFCFRFRPKSYTGDQDALNERTLILLQRGGSSYLSNTKIRGVFALRGCVLNYRTTVQDMERLLDDVRDAGRLALDE